MLSDKKDKKLLNELYLVDLTDENSYRLGILSKLVEQIELEA